MEKKEQIFKDTYGNEYTARELVMLGTGKRQVLNSFQNKAAGDWESDVSGIRKDLLGNLYWQISCVMDDYEGDKNFCESDKAILKIFQWFMRMLEILCDK